MKATQYKKVETIGSFSLYLNEPYYCIKKCNNGAYYHIETGECGGQQVGERMILFDENFNLLSEPIRKKEWEWKYDK